VDNNFVAVDNAFRTGLENHGVAVLRASAEMQTGLPFYRQAGTNRDK
jgi:hypothetical protein